MEAVSDFIFLGSKIVQTVTAVLKLRFLLLGRKAMTNLDSALKAKTPFADQVLSSQSYGFSSSRVWMLVGP